MNVVRAPQGNQPQDACGLAAATPVPSQGSATVSADSVEQVRARIREAERAARQARSAAADADEAGAEAASLRRRLPAATAAAVRAMREVRRLRGFTPVSVRHAWRRTLADERTRRTQALRIAMADRDGLVAQIAERDAQARDRRAESLRLRADASALPRLLDEAAACLRRAGGPAAEALAAAEAGLEPVLRRESDLDQAVRWVRWAQVHVGTALDRLGERRAWTGYREFFVVPPDTVQRRVEAARAALGGVRDVFDVLGRALDGLGVSSESWSGPQIPADLEPWFAELASDLRCQLRVTVALEDCAWSGAQLAGLLERIQDDHAATRRVLEGRRAHWGALLRGEATPGC